MKKLLLLILLISNISLIAQESAMTFNLRYSTENDKENYWELRKPDVVALLKKYKPDIFGTQEGTNAQVEYLNSELSNYKYTGGGRDDGKKKGEYSAIFYNINKYELIETSTFWLSDTPNKVSIGWDAAMTRVYTFASFLNLQTKETIYVFNAHFDHIGENARVNSAKQIVAKISELNLSDEKLIVMGDFNALEESNTIKEFKKILDDSMLFLKDELIGPYGTFNAFDINKEAKDRIDYIFTKNIKVKEIQHIDDKRPNKLWVSDHLPVLIKF